MVNSDLELFAETYINTSLEAAQMSPPLDMNGFYDYVFKRVSERTGLSEEDIKYLHHVFHWGLFLKSYSPLEVINPVTANGDPKIKIKNNPPEVSALVPRILREHRVWLEERMKKIVSKS